MGKEFFEEVQETSKSGPGVSLRRVMGTKKTSNRIVLRDNQRPFVTDVLNDFRTGTKVVLLAAGPNSGKTEMAISILRGLYDEKLVKEAAWFGHNTNVIKENGENRISKRDPELLEQGIVTVLIPQSAEAKKLRRTKKRFDLVIVDEAHHNYLAKDGLVQDFITKCKAKYVLLLTGTPSKFIALKDNKPKMHFFTLSEMAAAEQTATDGPYISELDFEIGTTSAYSIKESDYTDPIQGSVRDSVASETQAQTDATLGNIVHDIVGRLNGAPEYWGLKRKIPKNWKAASRALVKTIIAARSIKVANQIAKYLREQGVSVLVSHSKEGEEDGSGNIERFTKDDTNVLVVVNRAQLGFDMPELINFVDLTGTRNVDRIFQMMCRVVRTPAGRPKLHKLFVKAMPESVSAKFVPFMDFVLAMVHPEVYKEFDGRSLKLSAGVRDTDAELSLKKTLDREGNEDLVEEEFEPTGNGEERVQNSKPLEPLVDLQKVGLSGVFRVIERAEKGGYTPLARASLAERLGMKVDDPEANIQDTKKWCEQHNRRPRKDCEDHVEARFGALFTNYYNANSKTHRPEFKKWAEDSGYIQTAPAERVRQQKTDYSSFLLAHGRRPSNLNPVEKKLANFHQGRTQRDAAWIAELEKIPAYRPNKLELCRQKGAATGLTLITKKYINTNQALRWRCAEGHAFTRTLGALNAGAKECPECKDYSAKSQEAHKTRAINKGISPDGYLRCVQFAKSKQGQVLTPRGEFVGLATEVTWQCELGHKWKAKPSVLLSQECWCQKCGLANGGLARRLLTAAEEAKVCTAFLEGGTYRGLARDFGIDRGTVRNIIKRAQSRESKTKRPKKAA